MCKVMASEGTSSMGKGNGAGQPQQQAPAPPTISIPRAATQPLGASYQQPEEPPPATAGIASTQQLPASGPPVTTSAPRPQQPFGVMMPSSTSSVSSGQSLAAGLQEAMQQMQLQPSSSMSAPAGIAPSRQPAGQLDPRASQDSSDLAHLLGQAQQHAQQQQQTEEDGPATLFFAKVPRSATSQQIQEVFAMFGEVESLNLFVPYENSPSSKGCGLVRMRSYSDAVMAIAGLDNYKWEGMHSAMVVKLMPPQRQRQEQLESAASGSSSGFRSPAHASSSRVGQAPPMPRSSYAPASQMRLVVGVDVAPSGCAPNAYKLFVGNIPRAYSEPDLLPFFESIGPVRELIVLRDKVTQESKGSAFVWYATGEDADKAQASFNMQLVLQNRAGASSRPLVVRRAAPPRQASQMAGMPGSSVGVAGYPQAQMQQHAYAVAMPQGSVLARNPQGGYAPVAGTPAQGSYGYSMSVQASAAMPAAPMYMVPHAGYMQQQSQHQQPQPQQPQQQQQQVWQHQQQQPQGMSPVVPGQAPQPTQYVASVLMAVSEAPPAAGYAQVTPGYAQVMQPGSWTAQQQQQQQQQAAYVTGYEYGQMPSAGSSLPTSVRYGGAELARHVSADYTQHQQQQQQGVAPAVIMSSMPQAIPPVQQMAVGGMLQQPSHVLLSGSAGSSASSSAGPLATYQQFGNQHQLIVPLSGDQLSLITGQLPSVMAMSGTSITAEHNYACGSLALNVCAASQQQLNMAWQIINGLLGQQGGPAVQVQEGVM